MHEGGFIKIWWSSKDSLQFSNGPVWSVWSYLLLHTATKRQALRNGETIEPGQCCVSSKRLAEWAQLSDRTVRRIMQSFERDGAITVSNRGRNGTVVTICNWATYQSFGGGDGQDAPDIGRDATTQRRRNGARTESPKSPKSPEEGGVAADAAAPDSDRFLGAWRRARGVAKCLSLSGKRLTALSARSRERVATDDGELAWLDALELAVRTKFPLPCTRGSPGRWKPSVDWVLRPGSLQGVFEGKYDWERDRERNPPTIGAGQRFDGRRGGSAADDGFA
ncbi:MAG: hypothetical protein AAF805_00790 [Planctomycetota bacterium]